MSSEALKPSDYDLDAAKAVLSYVEDEDNRAKLIAQGYKPAEMPIVAVSDKETLGEVCAKLNTTRRKNIILGVYYTDRDSSDSIKILRFELHSSFELDQQHIEVFDGESVNAQIGAFCDWLSVNPGQPAGFPTNLANPQDSEGANEHNGTGRAQKVELIEV